MSLTSKMLLAVAGCAVLFLLAPLASLEVPMHAVQIQFRGPGCGPGGSAIEIPVPGPPIMGFGLLPEFLSKGMEIGDRGWVAIMRAGCKAVNAAQDLIVLRVGAPHWPASFCPGPGCMPPGFMSQIDPLSLVGRLDIGTPTAVVPVVIRGIIGSL
ncbi:MAG: hypothetical protein FJY88_03910 [Candidatus Eisenbacteria bacterium]|nr:hypothetical protein [Candidatus Eisenbacteria bacterium]